MMQSINIFLLPFHREKWPHTLSSSSSRIKGGSLTPRLKNQKVNYLTLTERTQGQLAEQKLNFYFHLEQSK